MVVGAVLSLVDHRPVLMAHMTSPNGSVPSIGGRGGRDGAPRGGRIGWREEVLYARVQPHAVGCGGAQAGRRAQWWCGALGMGYELTLPPPLLRSVPLEVD